MSNFICSLLLSSLALLCLPNSLYKSFAFDNGSLTPSETNHYHIVELSTLLPASTCSPSAQGSSNEGFLKLVHNHGPCSARKYGQANALSFTEILKRDQARLYSKQSRLSRKNENLNKKLRHFKANTIPLKSGSEDSTPDNFIVRVDLGTPKREFALTIDTGSSLVWTQCKPCRRGSCYKQRSPLFDPSKSSTFTIITCPSHTCNLANETAGFTTCSSRACQYEAEYADGSSTVGFIAKERLSVGSDTFNIIFGCGESNNFNTTADGILGLDQDPLSFVGQSAGKYQRVFSYCLPSKASETGFLKFGKSKPVSKSLKFTQLREGGYILDLVGIKLGNTKLPIVFKKGTASIDSGDVISRLPSKDYATLRAAYRKAMSRYRLAKPFDILDTCYHVGGHQKLQIPKMSFLFANGVAVDIPHIGIAYPVKFSVVCLPFAPYPGGDFTTFGNTQQLTLEIVYDVARGKIGFGNGGCK